MDARRVLLAHPVSVLLTAGSVLAALVTVAYFVGIVGTGSTAVMIRLVAVTTVLVGFATAFWFRPIVARYI